MPRILPPALAATICLLALPVMADEQAAIDGCIDQLRAVGGPDAQNGGEILSSEYSEAGTIVMLKDAGGTVWRCIGYNDGAVGELAVAEAADDGGGAMAGAPTSGEPTTDTVTVQFAAGTSGASYTSTLTPGSSTRYVLGASANQNLSVNVTVMQGSVEYQIFNPDQSFLLDLIPAGTPYAGQLWQSGDHVVEVVNRGGAAAEYAVDFSIN
ncbi:hypothetical protein E7811_03925 [Aliigemmobacter aestuarii]|uniref:Secreted protein n=1 Tax=Aliigemmobacter aestuarii TaxID=1445661 RepID=A0A4V3V0Q4_9RHOB|nr:hypothetical protein [Gemmobacter aestuarii]THD84882.1 hypothetical protein E7811_03925 [Gemmobacter aestuarii]